MQRISDDQEICLFSAFLGKDVEVSKNILKIS